MCVWPQVRPKGGWNLKQAFFKCLQKRRDQEGIYNGSLENNQILKLPPPSPPKIGISAQKVCRMYYYELDTCTAYSRFLHKLYHLPCLSQNITSPQALHQRLHLAAPDGIAVLEIQPHQGPAQFFQERDTPI